jgi:hypothetical protein
MKLCVSDEILQRCNTGAAEGQVWSWQEALGDMGLMVIQSGEG